MSTWQGSPAWVCPDCGARLGQAWGTVRSCPQCRRAYTCVTDEDRQRYTQARKGKK